MVGRIFVAARSKVNCFRVNSALCVLLRCSGMICVALMSMCLNCNIVNKAYSPIKPTGQPTGQKETNCLGMNFVELSPGSFNMGSNVDEKTECPRHAVTISKRFGIQTTEVTQGQWKAIMGYNPSEEKGDTLPVVNVSWNDCQLFIRKMNEKFPGKGYRLPTEAEWEYACRSGTTEDNYGTLYNVAWYGPARLNSVGKKQPNSWGLYDMLGNVWELCSDKFGEYPAVTMRDPKGPIIGNERVMRGGCWSLDGNYIRSSIRRAVESNTQNDSIGFRLVCECFAIEKNN